MRQIFLLLFLTSTLFGEAFTYLIHAKSGILEIDKTSKKGTLMLDEVSSLVPLFSIQGQRNMGFTKLSSFLQEWKGTPYAMLSYYGQDAKKNVYHSIPLRIDRVKEQGNLEFTVVVLNDLQLGEKTVMGETLLYIDNFDGADPGCLFPGASWNTPGCHKKEKSRKKEESNPLFQDFQN